MARPSGGRDPRRRSTTLDPMPCVGEASRSRSGSRPPLSSLRPWATARGTDASPLLCGQQAKVNKRVERNRRREGWEVPKRQPKTGGSGHQRLAYPARAEAGPPRPGPQLPGGLDAPPTQAPDGSCVVDEVTREAPATRVNRLGSTEVIETLAELVLERALPEHVRSDNGPELVGPGFVAQAVRSWTAAVGPRTACTEPSSPWKNGHVESPSSKPRDKLLNRATICSLQKAAPDQRKVPQRHLPALYLRQIPPTPKVRLILPQVRPFMGSSAASRRSRSRRRAGAGELRSGLGRRRGAKGSGACSRGFGDARGVQPPRSAAPLTSAPRSPRGPNET